MLEVMSMHGDVDDHSSNFSPAAQLSGNRKGPLRPGDPHPQWELGKPNGSSADTPILFAFPKLSGCLSLKRPQRGMAAPLLGLEQVWLLINRPGHVTYGIAVLLNIKEGCQWEASSPRISAA